MAIERINVRLAVDVYLKPDSDMSQEEVKQIQRRLASLQAEVLSSQCSKGCVFQTDKDGARFVPELGCVVHAPIHYVTASSQGVTTSEALWGNSQKEQTNR